MKLADTIFEAFHEKEQFTLKQAYEALPDSPQTTVRARIYDNLGILFKRVGKGIYAAIRDGQECILIEGDGRELSGFRDESVDCIITDHPWKDPLSNKGGNRSFADYECFQYTLEDFKEKARVLKTGHFLAEFLPAENENNYEQLFRIKQFAKECGLEYYCKVSWKKGKFVSNIGRKAKNTQDIMIFTKGKARNMRPDVKKSKAFGKPCFMSGAAGMFPAMFDVESVPRNQKIHQSELPVPLCEQLLEYLTTEGEVILDQFAGSGAIGVAALRRGRKCILIEKLHENVEKIKKRFSKEILSGSEDEKLSGMVRDVSYGNV